LPAGAAHRFRVELVTGPLGDGGADVVVACGAVVEVVDDVPWSGVDDVVVDGGVVGVVTCSIWPLDDVVEGADVEVVVVGASVVDELVVLEVDASAAVTRATGPAGAIRSGGSLAGAGAALAVPSAWGVPPCTE
jgi:hypothetical protein